MTQHTMTHRILIAGAGIGGLAAALACAQVGCAVTVLEAAPELGEAGAGIQLGPNAMKVIAALGLPEQVMQVASKPEAIVVADAASGRPISRILLGQAVSQRYGAAYLCVHRADLHRALLDAAKAAGVAIHTGQALQKYEHSAQAVCRLGDDSSNKYDALIGADGLWSSVRTQLLGEGGGKGEGHGEGEGEGEGHGAPRTTGHAAHRALIPASAMPPELRTPHVRTWWGRDVHVVSYPLRGGELWNLVVLAELPGSGQSGWSLAATPQQVMGLFAVVEPQLRELLQAGGSAGWRRWNLFDRAPLAAAQMARGRVALLGDAAHPMLPYMAQGAAMALEDAWQLSCSLSAHRAAPAALAHYVRARATRNSRVVHTARRNGLIFHLSGPLALARNAVLALQGTQVLGMPWLYGHEPQLIRPFASNPSARLG